MAKVFMTVVGAGEYDEVTYKIRNKQYTSRSIQKALMMYFYEENVRFDKFVFFLTEKARERNWEKVKYRDRELDAERDEEGLETFTQRFFPGKAVPVDIQDGVNDEDFLSIFRRIYESMEENDEITFDVTNGFRSIPFLFYPVISYAKELKHISIAHIYYAPYVKDVYPTELIDLEKYNEILDWANAAHIYRISGNAKEMMDLVQKRYDGFCGEEKKVFSQSKNLAQALLEMTDALLTCCSGNRKKSIVVQSNKLFRDAEKRNALDNQEYILFDALISHALETVKGFQNKKKQSDVGLEAMKWYKERRLFQLAYTAMQETIITYIIEAFAPQEDSMDHVLRGDVVSYALHSCYHSHGSQLNIDEKLNENPKLMKTKELAALFIKIASFFKDEDCRIFETLTETRNQMNHFGMNSSTRPINAKLLDRHYKETLIFIQRIDQRAAEIMTDKQAFDILNHHYVDASCVFVNFSNHMSAEWSVEQIEAAKKLVPNCTIIDIPFPSVSGEADQDQIHAIAEESVSRILDLCPSVVMCQGEFGVCWNVTSELKKRKIKTVYSCSERCAVEKKAGDRVEKVSVFRFVRFREYD